MITFGPVPSRRLGRSLGINHIPPKVCTYSCVYCQVGRTVRLRTRRCAFLEPEQVARAVASRVEASRQQGKAIDYLTFVPDGEPTLDRNLAAMITQLRPLGIPIAVLTNGSLLDRPEVRDALYRADLVSLKVDAVTEDTWRRVNRPHGRLRLPAILDGVREFAARHAGRVVTETMLVAGVNDAEPELRATASFLADLRAGMAYVAVPTRPPAEAWVRPAQEAAIVRAYEIFRALEGPVELLIGYEGDSFTVTGDPVADLLAIAAVHPLRETAVRRLLSRAGVGWEMTGKLLRERRLVDVSYGGSRYFLRPAELPRSPRVRTSAGHR